MATASGRRNEAHRSSIDYPLVVYAGVVAAMAAAIVLLLLGESPGWRWPGWALSAVALLGSATLLVGTVRRRRRAFVSGWTGDVVGPFVLCLLAGALVVAHAWGWALWIAV